MNYRIMMGIALAVTLLYAASFLLLDDVPAWYAVLGAIVVFGCWVSNNALARRPAPVGKA